MWLLLPIGTIMCAVVCIICDLFLTNDKPSPCDNCVYRFCVSNQHLTICDECNDGSNHKVESECAE